MPIEKRGRFRYLQVSTDEVFGTLSPTDPKFSETTPYSPNSPYAASKAASDHLVRAWHETYGLPVLISNCSNNYGPYQFPEKLIPLVIHNALAGKTLPIYGDGKQIRDWLYVGDHCAALATILARGEIGETYVIGGNEERANLAVVEHDLRAARQASAAQCRLLRATRSPSSPTGRAMTGAMPSMRASLSRELGWQPQHEISMPALRRRSLWYLDNADWVNDVDLRRLSRLGCRALRVKLAAAWARTVARLERRFKRRWSRWNVSSRWAMARAQIWRQPEQLRAAPSRANRPDVIVNAGAYTRVDDAEDQCRERHGDQWRGSLRLSARPRAAIGALVVHYSTDFVFDAHGRWPAGGERRRPIRCRSMGRASCAAMNCLSASGADHLILRRQLDLCGGRFKNFPLGDPASGARARDSSA